MRKNRIEFTQVPHWTHINSRPNACTFASAICLAGLEGKWIRLNAETQRKLLGAAIFGKQEFRVESSGYVTYYKKVCFGTDANSQTMMLAHLDTVVKSGKRLMAGCLGAGLFDTNFLNHELGENTGCRSSGAGSSEAR